MKKIRINELARELEVKPGAVIALLPDLGVSETKTHSSSIDEDVAVEIRRRLVREEPESVRTKPRPQPAVARTVQEDEALDRHESAAEAAAPPSPPAKPESKRPVSHEAPSHKESVSDTPVAPPRSLPLRPPVGATGGGRPVAPSIPIPAKTVVHHAPASVPERAGAAERPIAPPVVPPTPRPAAAKPQAKAPERPSAPEAPAAPERRVERPVQAAPAMAAPPMAAPGPPVAPAVPVAPQVPVQPAPASATPAVSAETPATPATPVAAAAAPAPAMPAAPAAPAVPAMPAVPSAPTRREPAAPRPNQPIARNQPIAARPGAPRPGQIISGPRQPLPGGEVPRTPVILPGQPRSSGPRPQGPQGPRVPGQHAGQPTRPPLAGQPAARPVVPPRADILARLQQQQTPRATPGQPVAPRPSGPMPGQPIYQGPRRGPGGGPGGPGGYNRGPGGPGRPMGRGRGPHPTSPVLAPPPPQTEAGRRDAGRKRAQRTREEVEGKLTLSPRRKEAFVPPPIDREITISEGITVKELADKLGVKAALVIKQMVDRKIYATINQTLESKLAEDLARAFGAATAKMSYEEESVQVVEQTEVEGDREIRPPVVTIMGHVDHGKTSLLDAVRSANVADREAGGITQHIGAYHVEINNRKIVFIDTPGHEAFTRMRARGSKVTDIVVLVVAADDGVMPQTREAIDHARAAKVPIIVAVNKIDKPDAQPDRVKQQLTDIGLMPEDWGGDTIFVPVSAKQKQNLDLLLEMILLVADVQELKGNPSRPAVATVLEAKLDRGRGPVATLLLRNGTLKVGDHYLCGTVFGKVRALFDDRGNPIREVGPSMPAELLGLESLPDVGDTLQVVTDLAKARQIADFREVKAREVAMAKTRVSLEKFHAQLREGETKELNIIIKADVGGTAEVLRDTLQKLSTEKVQIRVVLTGVGAISESDVDLASASNAIIVGFNVRPERKATEAAELEKVDIRLHTIIYELTDEIKKAMVGMLEPVYKETYKGRAEVREVFRITKVGTVAGCYVQDGAITRDAQVRLLRDNVVVHTGRLESLKRFKNDAAEVKSGFECGIAIANYNDLKPGDVIEAFVKEQIAPDLSA